MTTPEEGPVGDVGGRGRTQCCLLSGTLNGCVLSVSGQGLGWKPVWGLLAVAAGQSRNLGDIAGWAESAFRAEAKQQ